VQWIERSDGRAQKDPGQRSAASVGGTIGHVLVCHAHASEGNFTSLRTISTQVPAPRADYIGQMLFCPALLTPRETWLRGSLREIAVIVVPCGAVELHVIVADDALLGAWWATADTMRNRPALVFIA
jgi:hypothetical protein